MKTYDEITKIRNDYVVREDNEVDEEVVNVLNEILGHDADDMMSADGAVDFLCSLDGNDIEIEASRIVHKLIF